MVTGVHFNIVALRRGRGYMDVQGCSPQRFHLLQADNEPHLHCVPSLPTTLTPHHPHTPPPSHLTTLTTHHPHTPPPSHTTALTTHHPHTPPPSLPTTLTPLHPHTPPPSHLHCVPSLPTTLTPTTLTCSMHVMLMQYMYILTMCVVCRLCLAVWCF